MRFAITRVKPDAVIHLGDYYDDGETMQQEFKHIRFHQVPGNCDRFRCLARQPEVLCYDVGGVRMFMTHGHLQNVKYGTYALEYEARKQGAAIVLYGHTHIADLRQEDGMWIMNPGSCGSSGGSVGLIEITDKKICCCKILRNCDLEEFV